MHCEICKRNVPQHGVTLTRVNEKGVKGIWRCNEHLTDEQRQSVDPIVQDITNIIEEDNERQT